MCSQDNTLLIQQLNNLEQQLKPINKTKMNIENQIQSLKKEISKNSIYEFINNSPEDIIQLITKSLSSHIITILYNTNKSFRERIKNIYLIIIFKFKFDENKNYRKINHKLGMHNFSCVFPIQYMRTKNIHINYILANFINFYDVEPHKNKLHFKNNYINICEYNNILKLYNIISSNTTSLKKNTNNEYKTFLNNYDIKYTRNNINDKINHFIDVFKNSQTKNSNFNNNFYANYNCMKVFLGDNIPSIKPFSFRGTHTKHIINIHNLYYRMHGFMYEKNIDSVYILN